MLEPLFQHVAELKRALGDEQGAEQTRRAYLKGMLALQVRGAGADVLRSLPRL